MGPLVEPLREQIQTLRGFSPASQDQILVVTVLYMPRLFDSGLPQVDCQRGDVFYAQQRSVIKTI